MPTNEAELAKNVVELAKETKKLSIIVNNLSRQKDWSAYANPKKFLLFSLLNGLFVVVGSTIGLALIFYLLNLLGYIPWLGNFFAALKETIAAK